MAVEAKNKAEQERLKRERDEAAARVMESEKRAAREKLEADERARLAAVRAKQESEAAVKRERERIVIAQQAEIEAARQRQSMKEHRESIHGEIEKAILDNVQWDKNFNKSFVGEIVELIADGKVPHVNIKY